MQNNPNRIYKAKYRGNPLQLFLVDYTKKYGLMRNDMIRITKTQAGTYCRFVGGISMPTTRHLANLLKTLDVSGDDIRKLMSDLVDYFENESNKRG